MKSWLLPVTALSLLVGRCLAQPSPSRLHLGGCRTNLRILGTACEIYRTDWGHYPLRLRQLTLRGHHNTYLKAIPTCPAAGSDTYSQAYWMRRSKFDEDRNFAGGIDFFMLYCAGRKHTQGQPVYDCRKGVILKR